MRRQLTDDAWDGDLQVAKRGAQELRRGGELAPLSSPESRRGGDEAGDSREELLPDPELGHGAPATRLADLSSPES